MEEEFEKICFNCNAFMGLDTEYSSDDFGICLNDPDFEPYIDVFFENHNFDCCQALIDKKKISGETEGCDDFELLDMDGDNVLGIDDELAPDLLECMQDGIIDAEKLQAVLMREAFKNKDWSTEPVDCYFAQLRGETDGTNRNQNAESKSQNMNKDPYEQEREQREALRTIGMLIHNDNKAAYDGLFAYFMELTTPARIEDVRHKIAVFDQLERHVPRGEIIPILVEELSAIPSNNTTLQWISRVFAYFRACPLESVKEPLETMLKDKKWSYRRKRQIKEILQLNSSPQDRDDWY